VTAVAQAVINNRFIFHIKVTSTNHQFISNIYARGYTAESVEWLPRTYDTVYLSQIQSSAPPPLPSFSGTLDKGKVVAQQDITPSPSGTLSISGSATSSTPTVSDSATSNSSE